jgi:signal transduction histidine kinase
MESLADTYHHLGHDIEAFKVLHAKDSLRDLLNLDRIGMELNNVAEELALARLQKAKEETDKQKQVAETRTQLALISLVLVIMVCGLLVRYLAQVRKQKQLLDKAHQELDTLADGLNKKAEELEAANDHKKMLLGVIAHDVRAPLSNLKGVLELLSKRQIKLEDISELVARLDYDVDEARDLLDDLLLWAKNEMHGLDTTPSIQNVDLVIDSVLRQQRPLAFSQNVTFSVEPTNGIYVWANEALLKIVLRNLVANAVQNSPIGEQVSIHYGKKDDFCQIRIANSTSVMPERERLILSANLTSMTTLHKKGDATRGFGLVLVRDFLHLLCGYAEVDTPPEGGTIVTIYIPKPKQTSQSIGTKQVHAFF